MLHLLKYPLKIIILRKTFTFTYRYKYQVLGFKFVFNNLFFIFLNLQKCEKKVSNYSYVDKLATADDYNR